MTKHCMHAFNRNFKTTLGDSTERERWSVKVSDNILQRDMEGRLRDLVNAMVFAIPSRCYRPYRHSQIPDCDSLDVLVFGEPILAAFPTHVTTFSNTAKWCLRSTNKPRHNAADILN